MEEGYSSLHRELAVIRPRATLTPASFEQALDPQIPNILVHNEWRGTFEEFEEAVEFGELDLFLRIDASRVAAAQPDVVVAVKEEPTPYVEITPQTASKLPKLPPAPTAAPRMAPVGSGAGPRRNSLDDFLDSLDMSQLNLDSMSESDVSAILEEGESAKAKQAHESAIRAPKDTWRDANKPAAGSSIKDQPVRRTYFPTEQAGTKPLRLPKMGNGTRSATTPSMPQPLTPKSHDTDMSGSRLSPRSPRSPTHARFSASQNSSRALAAEASASASARHVSARQFRTGLDSGKMLQEVVQDYSADSSSSRNLFGSTDADAILEELGLANIAMTEEEAEAFLLDGVIPEGMDLGGSRLRGAKSKASKAREQEAAKAVASKARDLTELRQASAAVARQRQADQLASSQDDAKDKAEQLAELTKPVEVSQKTKDVLERAREKRASRQIDLAKETARLSLLPSKAPLVEEEETLTGEKQASEPATEADANATAAVDVKTSQPDSEPVVTEPEISKAEAEGDKLNTVVPPSSGFVAESSTALPVAGECLPESKEVATSEDAKPTTSLPPTQEADKDSQDENTIPAASSREAAVAQSPAGPESDGEEDIDTLLDRLQGMNDSLRSSSRLSKDSPIKQEDGLATPLATTSVLPGPVDETPAKIESGEPAIASLSPAIELSPSDDNVTTQALTSPSKAIDGSKTPSPRASPARPPLPEPIVTPGSRRAMDIPRRASRSPATPSSYVGSPPPFAPLGGVSSNSSIGSPPSASGSSRNSLSGGSTKSPTMTRSRSKSKLPSLRSLSGSLRRKSSQKDLTGSNSGIGSETPPLPTSTSGGGGYDRANRTLSQILRDADAALAGDFGDDAEGEATPGEKAGEESWDSRRESRFLPSDGLGEPEYQS